MAKFGIGASVLRKEDERFLRGRGQYVGDLRLPGMRDVAFVRSPVAHARLRQVRVPEQFRNAVFTAKDLAGVKPIVSAPPLKGFKRSAEPILATGKLRYVGEIVAMCVARTRAEAEDIAGAVALDYDELPVVDRYAGGICEMRSALVHEEWGDNVFVEFSARRTDRGGGERRRHQSHQANSNGAPLHAADGGPRRHRLPGRAAARC